MYYVSDRHRICSRLKVQFVHTTKSVLRPIGFAITLFLRNKTKKQTNILVTYSLVYFGLFQCESFVQNYLRQRTIEYMKMPL